MHCACDRFRADKSDKSSGRNKSSHRESCAGALGALRIMPIGPSQTMSPVGASVIDQGVTFHHLISRGVVTHAMCGSISKCICLGYTYSKSTVNHCLEMFGTYFPFREDEKSKDDGDSSTIIIKIVFQLEGSIHTTCDVHSLMFIQHTI